MMDAIAALQGRYGTHRLRLEDWQANLGYRRAMTYVLQLANDEYFEYTAPNLVAWPSLHDDDEYREMQVPGLWRPGPVWVQNSLSGDIVYEAPEAGYYAVSSMS